MWMVLVKFYAMQIEMFSVIVMPLDYPMIY